jgi:hypothetical protein
MGVHIRNTCPMPGPMDGDEAGLGRGSGCWRLAVKNSLDKLNCQREYTKVLFTVVAKLLRMTQILISTKFAASVSLDIVVRCCCGIVKYNYKQFIRVNGFN